MGYSLLLFFLTCLQILEAVENTSESKRQVKTQRTTFTESSFNPNTTVAQISSRTSHIAPSTARITPSTVRTVASSAGNTDEGEDDGHTDHAHDGSRGRNGKNHEDCPSSPDTCRHIVIKCGPSLLRDMSRDGDIEDYEDKPLQDPCRCLFHCFDHFGKACRSLTRKLERMRDDSQKEHTIFAVDHLGPLVGIFVTGVVVGILIALLIANVVKQCMNPRPVQSESRETRSNSYGNLSVINRGPMPPPSLECSGQGLYSANPAMISPPPKYERTSDSRSVTNRGIYEEVAGEPLFPVSDDTLAVPHVYLVLEKEDPENEPEIRNGSSPTDGRAATTTSCPDVVTDATNNNNRISNHEPVSTPVTKIVQMEFDEETITEDSKL